MSTEEAKEEDVTPDSLEPAEECDSPALLQLVSEPEPSEPEPGPQGPCQGWLLELLDDVRYLISCTNWY